MSDILSRINRKHSPFVVPEGYFASFTQSVMEQISEPAAARPVCFDSSAAPKINLATRVVRFIPYIGAASIAAMVAVFAHFNTSSSNTGYLDVAVEIAGVQFHENAANYTEADAVYDYMMLDNANLISYASDN